MTVALAVVGALAGVAALAMTMMIAAAVVREDAAQAAVVVTMTRSPVVDVVATKAVAACAMMESLRSTMTYLFKD